MPAHPHTQRRRAPEKAVQAACKRLLTLAGFHVSDLSQSRATQQTAGLPDLYAMGHGHAVWVEVKAPNGRVTPAQEAWHETARANGQTVLVPRSAADLIEPLRALGAPIQ